MTRIPVSMCPLYETRWQIVLGQFWRGRLREQWHLQNYQGPRPFKRQVSTTTNSLVKTNGSLLAIEDLCIGLEGPFPAF
jgi:hypothetical protein